MKRLRLIGIVLVVLAVIVFVLGFVVLPPMVRPVVESTAQERGIDLKIGSLSVGVLRGAVSMGDVVVANPPGFTGPSLAAVDTCTVNARLLPLLSGDMVVQSVTVRRPELHAERDAAGAINLTALLDQMVGAGGDADGEEAAGRDARPFRVNAITVHGMVVSWTDRTVPGPARISLEDLDVTVRDLYTPMPAGTMDTQLTAAGRVAGADAGTFRAQGRGNFLADKLDFTLQVHLDKVALSTVQAYTARAPVVPTGGMVSGDIDATCEQNHVNAVAKMHLAGLTVAANTQSGAVTQLPASVVSGLANVDPNHDVEVKVSGDIRDPKFHLVNAVMMAAVNDVVGLGTDAAGRLTALAGGAAAGATDLGGETLDKAADAGATTLEKGKEAVGSVVERLPFGRQ